MHRRVNILQYLKTPSGRWQWAAIPKHSRTGNYIWSKVQTNNFYFVWREQNSRRYKKAGRTPFEALDAKRRKEFKLAGRAVLGKDKLTASCPASAPTRCDETAAERCVVRREDTRRHRA